MAVFVSRPTPFLDEFFELLLALEYPKANVCRTVDLMVHSTKFNKLTTCFHSKVDLVIYSGDEYHYKDVDEFAQREDVAKGYVCTHTT